MIFSDESEVISFLQTHQKEPDWIRESRDYSKVLKALVNGEKFTEVLIERIEKIESADRAIARKRYSKDIRDLFDRVMQPRLSVFSASGGAVTNKIQSEPLKEKFLEHIDNFKGQKSIKQYLSENLFTLEDTDPNGLIFLEYYQDEKIYPTYKSIQDIHYYLSNGQMLEFVVFRPVELTMGGTTYMKWRVVDDKRDYCILQDGENWVYLEERSFDHPFGQVPGIILSDYEKTGTERRKSPLYQIEELAKDYARDKSILTIYKFQNGFPRHWRYIRECRSCHGTGKDGTSSCPHCDGKGEIRRNDITDTTEISLPREDDPIVTPEVEGFVSPDLATWARYKEDLEEMENRIDATIWGQDNVREGGNETATGRFIDLQPVMNRLNRYADSVEWIQNTLTLWVERWVYNNPEKERDFYETYGRRFIIESPDNILEKYNNAREKGANNTVLDRLLEEYILSRFANNPVMVEELQKKMRVEPYLHNSLKEVGDVFGAEEAKKKVVFNDFWEQADKERSVSELKQDFEQFIASINLNININE